MGAVEGGGLVVGFLEQAAEVAGGGKTCGKGYFGYGGGGCGEEFGGVGEAVLDQVVYGRGVDRGLEAAQGFTFADGGAGGDLV